MQSSSAYSSAIFSGSRVLPSERPSIAIAGSKPSACAAQATAEASRVGFGETSYEDWLCSVTTMPSKPDRTPCSSSAYAEKMDSCIRSGSTTSYGAVTTELLWSP